MGNLGEHPFNYRMDEIRDHINDLVNIGEFDYAVKSIEYIKIQYVSGLNSSKIDSLRIPFYHLKSHHHSDLNHAILGTKYPDGSKHSLIYELNKLIGTVYSKKNKIENQPQPRNQHGLKAPGKGIVLFYLMNYGSGKFKYTTEYENLARYLEELNLGGSGAQAYNKGIVKLSDEKRNRIGKRGVFTKKEFLCAIDFLKGVDSKAYDFANKDFNYYCADEINEEGDNPDKFFKN
tara:strand:- start:222 stop:920 length:699 start_codon:yes stop_codon:yes gene_type:complete